MSDIIFSDIDGTLVHKLTDHDNLIQVPEETRFITQEAVNLIEKIRESGDKFAIITGRRKEGFDRLGAVMGYDYAIIEHGCVILNETGYDQDWAAHLGDTIGEIGKRNGYMWEFEKELHSMGYKTDSRGRDASFRVFKTEPGNLGEHEKQYIENLVQEKAGQYGLTTTRNQVMLDVLPVLGGKANAIKYIQAQNHQNDGIAGRVIALGDDVNDLGMMEVADWAACPGNAIDQIKDAVMNKGGYVSKELGHKGTIDILMKTYEK